MTRKLRVTTPAVGCIALATLFGAATFAAQEARHTTTAIMFAAGHGSKGGKEITFVGDYVCPMTGQHKQTNTVLQVLGKDKHVVEMHEKAPHGKEYKSMELVYTRAT